MGCCQGQHLPCRPTKQERREAHVFPLSFRLGLGTEVQRQVGDGITEDGLLHQEHVAARLGDLLHHLGLGTQLARPFEPGVYLSGPY